jgi:hypothetical protein
MKKKDVKKEVCSMRLLPAIKAYLISKYGTLQAGIDLLINKDLQEETAPKKRK